MKNCLQQSFRPLISNKVPNGPWKIISTNLITQLPEVTMLSVLSLTGLLKEHTLFLSTITFYLKI